MTEQHLSRPIDSKRSFGRRIVTWAAMAVLGASLAGCVVYPAGGYYHPYHYGYYGGYYR
jgi:hypothetical protein